MRRIAALLFLMLGIAGTAHAQPPLRVVASFSIIADLAARTGGALVEVTPLVAPGRDLHQFQPRPDDARILAGADLVVVNGLGTEGWLTQLVRASGYKGPVVVLGDKAVKRGQGASPDPHAWQDVANARRFVAAIAEALAASRPTEAQAFRDHATGYDRELAALEDWILRQIATLPAERRFAVVPHDAFGYFAAAYGITIEPLQGSTDSEPSTRRFAGLSKTIRAEHITALFGEANEDNRAMRQLAAECGTHLAGELYADSLSPPGGPAPDYIALMRHNVTLMVEAMR